MKIVVHTPDVVGERMAGPGIRAFHLARELAQHGEVTLIAKGESASGQAGEWAREILDDSTTRPLVHFAHHGSSEARAALRAADVLVGQPARGFRKRRRAQKIVYDLFDPTVLELRELYGSAPSLRQRIHLAAEWMRLAEAMRSGDLLMCAAARQREFYEKLQSSDTPWIEVPFGVEIDSACEKPRDNIVIWGGGTWEWLDPAAAVEAVLRVNADGVRCRLLFLGRSRPNRDLVDRRREDRFDELIRRGKGLVSANQEWVPYRERLSWLRSGKIAIMLHRRTGEADYSIRTRLFDAIAAGTPVVASAGGFAAELVREEHLGVVVPPGDVDAVARAIRRLLTDDDFYSRCVGNLERIRPRFTWDVVTRPLIDAVLKWRDQLQK